MSTRMQRSELTIAAPCTVDWKKMTPADGGRFCGDCKKVVRDFSTMSEREARALLKTARGGELCVRFVFDAHGRVFFGKDAPRKDALLPAHLLSRARRAALVAAAALPLAAQACDPLDMHDDVMGSIAYTPVDAGTDAEDTSDASDASAHHDAKADASTSSDASADAEADADAGEPDGAPQAN